MRVDLNPVVLGIVAYNTNISIISDAVTSILGGSMVPKIVILCNSSDLGYQGSVEDLCKRKKLVFLGGVANKGFGQAHNEIVGATSAEWYICCNPDIVVENDTIERLLAFGRSHQGSVLLAPKVLNCDGTNQYLARRYLSMTTWMSRQIWRVFPSLFVPYERRFDYNKSQKTEFVSGCFFAIRYRDYLKIDGFSQDFFLYYEDADLSFRAKELGDNYYVADAVVKHLWGKAWSNSFDSLLKQMKSLGIYFLKHRSFF